MFTGIATLAKQAPKVIRAFKGQKNPLDLVSIEDIKKTHTSIGDVDFKTGKKTDLETFAKQTFPDEYYAYTAVDEPLDAERFKSIYEDAYGQGLSKENFHGDYERYLDFSKQAQPFKEPMSQDDFWTTFYKPTKTFEEQVSDMKLQSAEIKKFYKDERITDLKKRKKSLLTPEQEELQAFLDQGKNAEERISGIIHQQGFWPENTAVKDPAGHKVLYHQARGLLAKADDPEKFIADLRAKDPKIMDSLSSALDNYKADVQALWEDKVRIVTPGTKIHDKLEKVVKKFTKIKDPKMIRRWLVDFSHMFEMKTTAKAAKKGKIRKTRWSFR